MKAHIKIISLLFLFTALTFSVPVKTSAQGAVVSFQVFYDELSPYGTWVYHQNYGYVWVPDVGPDFYPYGTDGYWILTNHGWTWVSYYPWGWAPFHYGRWYIDVVHGPMWIPGYEWGPGWVTWRMSGDYYGWAPIGPGVTIGVAYGSNYSLPHHHWRFVKRADFGKRNIYNFYANTSHNVTLVSNSTVINNIQTDRTTNVRYNTGPDRSDVEKHTGRAYSQVVVKDSPKPGQKLAQDQLQLYRPRVEKSTGSKKPAPANPGRLENLKSSPDRPSVSQHSKTTQPAQAQPSRDTRGNTGKSTETVKPPTTSSPSKNTGNVKQPDQAGPSKNTGNVKQPGQAGSSKNTGQVKPSGKSSPSGKPPGKQKSQPSKPPRKK